MLKEVIGVEKGYIKDVLVNKLFVLGGLWGLAERLGVEDFGF